MFKDISTRYDLPHETDYVPPKRILQYCVEEYISRGVKEDHTDLKIFLDDVIPFEGKRHFIYVQDEDGTTYNFHLDRYDCLEGKRNQFVHILSNYAQLVMTEDETIEFCEQYFPEDNAFHTEMIATVKAAFSRHSTYWYNYCTIADILGFDEKDIAESRCNFSTERKAEAKKERNRRKYQKRTARVKTDAQIKREYCYNYIKDNIDKPVKQLVAELGLSQSTVYRIRSGIKAKNRKTIFLKILTHTTIYFTIFSFKFFLHKRCRPSVILIIGKKF